MAGPEATQVLSLIRATISTLECIEEVHRDTSAPESLPAAFPAAAKYLRAVYDALDTARKQIRQGKDDSTCGEMKLAAAGCKEKASRLEGLFLQVVPSAADDRMERYRRAVREMGVDNRVETLMKGIIEGARLMLMVDDEMRAAAALQLRSLGEAMKEVSTIPPSLPVEGPAASSINNFGFGPQNVNTGSGPQNNNNGRGQQFIGGSFHGFNPLHSQ